MAFAAKAAPTFWNEWEYVRDIQSGSQGALIEIKHKTTNESCALKIYGPKTPRTLSFRMLREVSSKCDDFMKFYEYLIVPNIQALGRPNVYAIRMELIRGESVADWMYKLMVKPNGHENVMANGGEGEAFLLSLMEQISAQLQCLHSRGYVHRDIKPENIMYETTLVDGFLHYRFFLIDFDLACQIGSEECIKGVVGTPGYLPPEYFRERELEDETALDIWSFGVTLFEIASGNSFLATDRIDVTTSEGFSQMATLTRASAVKIRKPNFHFYKDDEVEVIIKELLNPDPSKRPFINEVIEGISEIITHAPMETEKEVIIVNSQLACIQCLEIAAPRHQCK